MRVTVQEAPFDPGAEVTAFTAGATGAGAVVTFTGLVRNDGGTLRAMQNMTPEAYAQAVTDGTADPIRACGKRDCASVAGDVGLVLIWIAAALTAFTGWEYFRKSLPYLREEG